VTVPTTDAPGIHSGASSSTSGSFPGYGEDAPLDLSGLTPAGLQAVTSRLLDKTFDAFAETAAAVKNCAHPVRLTGRSQTFERTQVSELRAALYKTYGPSEVALGEPVASFSSDEAPLGVLYRPCGNRRADVCPSCSRTYARDTFAMIDAGLSGGKTVSATVADNPLLFATLTAPSFGTHVHRHDKAGKRCRPRARDKGARCPHGRPLSCHKVHSATDAAVGAPFCPECHDWTTALVWQWWAPELWRRTTIELKRALAKKLDVPESRLGKVASVQFVKVAEYQTRGLVHFHALLRLDGNDGPGSPAPLDGIDLAQLLAETIGKVTFEAPPVDHTGVTRVLSWGNQVDLRVVRDGDRTDDPDAALTPGQVAGYLAKYASKDVSSIRLVDTARPHLARLTSTCHDIFETSDALYGGQDNPYELIKKWAHMLGFRGHFSTKSRRYSITLGRLRRARARYQQFVSDAHRNGENLEEISTADLEARLLAEDDEETTLVIGEWAYQGSGWTNAGDEALALAAAARAREYDQWKVQTKNANR
jgi:hypothetical protein